MMQWPIRVSLCLRNRTPALGQITRVDLKHAEWDQPDQPVVPNQVVWVGQRLSATFRAAGTKSDWEERLSKLRELEERRDAPLRDFLSMPSGIECRICLTLQRAGGEHRLQVSYRLVLDLQWPYWRPVVSSQGEGPPYPWLDISSSATWWSFEKWFEIVWLTPSSQSGLPPLELRREAAAAKALEAPALWLGDER